MTYDCDLCEDTGWVCENHSTRPWMDRKRACKCDGPGIPCPECNCPDHGAPRMPAGVTTFEDIALIEAQIGGLVFH